MFPQVPVVVRLYALGSLALVEALYRAYQCSLCLTPGPRDGMDAPLWGADVTTLGAAATLLSLGMRVRGMNLPIPQSLGQRIPSRVPLPVPSGPREVRNLGRPTQVDEQGLSDMIHRVCVEYGVDEALVRAIIKVESNYHPNSRSGAGAIGLMQLMPATAAHFHVSDPYNPEANVRGGVQFLRYLDEQPNLHGNVRAVLAAYRDGVSGFRMHGFTQQNEDYINRVLRWRERYETPQPLREVQLEDRRQ